MGLRKNLTHQEKSCGLDVPSADFRCVDTEVLGVCLNKFSHRALVPPQRHAPSWNRNSNPDNPCAIVFDLSLQTNPNPLSHGLLQAPISAEGNDPMTRPRFTTGLRSDVWVYA